MVVLLSWGRAVLQAQPFEWRTSDPYRSIEPFKVDHSNSNPPRLYNPLNGGINRPIFQIVDINGDTRIGEPKYDLFILDVDGRLQYYEGLGLSSSGSPTQPGFPRFLLKELDYFNNPNLQPIFWFRFVDIDGDGDLDLFLGGRDATVNFLRNEGYWQSPLFVIHALGLKDTSGNLIRSESINIPAFADVDGDGDLDFFSGNSIGTITYYENLGGQEMPRFRFVTDRYQGIEIVGPAGKVTGSQAGRMEQQASRHGAMAITFTDIDQDGDLDLFWGDFFNRSLYFLENRGTRTAPQFVLRDSTYPKPNIILTDGFNMPQFIDIDGDGVSSSGASGSDLDLIVGVLNGFATVDNLLFYRNTSQPLTNTITFQLETTRLLETLDVGAASSPVFADVDGDLLPDLFIGSEDGKLFWYKRFGAKQTLRFVLQTERFVNLSGLLNISPTFGDIDGDGKPDLIVGDAGGRLRLFRGSNYAQEDTTFALRSTSFGQNASPVLVDLERRGLLDLFVGTGGGKVIYYRNVGTRTSPQFVRRDGDFPSIDSIDVGDDAKPAFTDMDGDGDIDLIIGSRDSSLSFWRNTDFRFTRVPNFFATIPSFPRVAPAFLDVDDNVVPDLILGNYKGGLYFYYNKNINWPVSVGNEPGIPQKFSLEQNYPNPFNPQTTIRYTLAEESQVMLTVFDLLGREVARLVHERQPPGAYSAVFDATTHATLPSGVYFYRLNAGSLITTRKMLYIR